MSGTDKFSNLLVSLGETYSFSEHFTFFLGSGWQKNFVLGTLSVLSTVHSLNALPSGHHQLCWVCDLQGGEHQPHRYLSLVNPSGTICTGW